MKRSPNGTVVFYNNRVETFLPADAPTGSQLIPQNALLAVSVSTDAEEWQQLRDYGTPETQAIVDAQLTTLRDTLLTANGYNYEQDIQPWLGKQVTIAYLSSQIPTAIAPPKTADAPVPAPLAQNSLVMVLPIANLGQFQQFAANNSGKSAKFVERNYKGIQIRERPGTTGSKKIAPTSTTVLGNFLVVTTDPRLTERVIDTYKGEPSLAATTGYLQALAQIQGGQTFAQMYLNVPAATAVTAANSARSLDPQNLAQLQQKQGVAATLSLESEGIRWRGISWLKPNSQQRLVVENNAKIMPLRLPSNTLLMISGGNLQRLWQDYLQGAQSSPITPISPENIRTGLKSKLGLDLEQDFLSWMGGEFSLSLIPVAERTPSGLGAGLVFMVQASDRHAAETSLRQLDEVMTKDYQFYVQETQLGDRPVVTWTSPLNGLTATHGWLDGNVAFITIGAPITSAILPTPKVPLTENKLFQQTVLTELSPSNGHFFIDVDRTINSGNLAFPQLSPEIRVFTNAIRALGVTAAINSDRSSRFDIFVLLKKSDNSSPLPTSSPSPKTPPALKGSPVPKPSLSPKVTTSPSPASSSPSPPN